MASDIGRAMARLKHRDIRTRRRAVRTLFEQDDPTVLEAFKPLLDDKDPWFVSKALDAYRMWGIAAGVEAVATLLRHKNLDVRRAGANLLIPLGQPGKSLAFEALTDTDAVVQKKAAKALLMFDDHEVVERLIQHQNDTVRMTGMQHPTIGGGALLVGLNDPHAGVREAALEGVLKHDVPVDMEALMPFLKRRQQTVKILIWVAKNEPDRLQELTAQLQKKDMKELSDYLREEVIDSTDPLLVHLLEAGMLEPVARWVIRLGASEDVLRWNLISDSRLNVIERSKLLERLIGRADEPEIIERAKRLLEITDEELLKVACENLSTAASELDS